MTSRLTMRITVSLFVLMTFFTVRAQADQGTTFRLRIDDLSTGVSRVITDNQGTVFGDWNNGPTPTGTIHFAGYIGSSAFVTINATSGTGSDGGGSLTLNGSVLYETTGSDVITISVEDSGYTAPAPAVNFVSTVAWGDLPTTATSISLNSWLDAANNVPIFGANTAGVALARSAIVIPTDAPSVLSEDSQQFTGTFAPLPASAGVAADLSGVNPSNGYSIISQVAVTFNGNGGQADFSLTAADGPLSQSVPEPTSLLLLGSALLGFGIFRRTQ
jgi:hypothetical protein